MFWGRKKIREFKKPVPFRRFENQGYKADISWFEFLVAIITISFLCFTVYGIYRTIIGG